jgi:hypothetical protein
MKKRNALCGRNAENFLMLKHAVQIVTAKLKKLTCGTCEYDFPFERLRWEFGRVLKIYRRNFSTTPVLSL